MQKLEWNTGMEQNQTFVLFRAQRKQMLKRSFVRCKTQCTFLKNNSFTVKKVGQQYESDNTVVMHFVHTVSKHIFLFKNSSRFSD